MVTATTPTLPSVGGPTAASSPGSTTAPEPDTDRLALEHLGLADALARRFSGRGEDDDDLRQVARCGLVQATRRYDPTRGPFAPYAAATIDGVLKHYFRDDCWVVRPPRRTQQLAVRITRQWDAIAQRRGRVPNDHDLSEELHEPLTAVRGALRAAEAYRTVGLEEDSATAAGCTDDPGVIRCEDRLLLARLWARLDAGERELLWLRYWEGCSQTEIAGRIGTRQMQVSRLLARTLVRLRALLEQDDRAGPHDSVLGRRVRAPRW